MTRLGHILKELGRNFARHWSTVLGSLMSLTLLFLLFDLFWIAAGTSQSFYDRLLADLQMEVIFSEELEDKVASGAADEARTLEGVLSVQYISKEDARAELSRLVGTDLLVGYDSINPLPRSMILTFQPGYLTSTHLGQVEAELRQVKGVDEIFYSRDWLTKMENGTQLIQDAGVVLGLLILLAALISSANNIRLMTQTRAIGFGQMRLLGGGKFFLAAPFLLEGLLVGSISAALGWAVILYAKDEVSFTQFDIIIPQLKDVGIFVAACGVLGLISGYLGIRKLLR